MAALEFSRSDVEVLVGKLLAAGLSEHEQVLLLAIFTVAAKRVSPVGPQASPDLGGLREQLINSFLPVYPGDEYAMIYRKPRRIGIDPYI